MRVGDVPIRYFLIPLVIVCLMGLLGLKIRDNMEDARIRSNKLYETAIPAEDKDTYDYVLDTQQGVFYTRSNFVARQPVSVPEIKGEYTELTVEEEHYVQKQRWVPEETDEDGNVIRAGYWETYWEWDLYKTDKYKTKELDVHGHVYPYSKFRGMSNEYITRLEPRIHVRVTYRGVPKEKEYTFIANATEQGLKGLDGKSDTVYVHTTAFDDFIESKISNGKVGKVFFWVLWVGVIIGLNYGYFYWEFNQ